MKILLLLSMMVSLLGSLSSAEGAPCQVSLRASQHWTEGAVQVWVFDGLVVNEASFGFQKGPALSRFQKDVRADVPSVDPVFLLRRQMKIFEKAGRDVRVFRNLLAQASTWIHPISCLEAALMDFYGQRLGVPLYPHYSEFGAYILHKGSRGTRRIYLHINPQSAQLPQSRRLETQLLKDLRSGYRLGSHLHNHPFTKGVSGGDIAGTTIPSLLSGDPSGEGFSIGDFSAYKLMSEKLNLQEARITNGFSTLRIPVRDLPRLLK